MKRLSLFLVFVLVQFLIAKAQYIPGESYFSEDDYIEYIAGNMPVIISVPHGGYLEPLSIPDRTCSGCSVIRDAYTQELARLLADDLHNLTGCYPHVVINLLHRKKLDANREIGEAADGNLEAETAWYAFQSFIDTSKFFVDQQYEKGLLIDLHGHGHDIQRLELGYLLSKNELQLPDSVINTSTYIDSSSIRNLILTNINAYSHAELIRGDLSLGTLSSENNYPAVPSLDMPFPADEEPYFSGGYITRRHGSKSGNTVDAIQIECDSSVRFGLANRQAFADSLSMVLLNFMESHYFPGLSENNCLPILSADCEGNQVVGLAASPAPNGSNVFLSWDAVNGADLYQVKGRRVGTSPFGQFITPNLFKNVGGLIPGTAYEWKVRARCQADNSVSNFSIPDTFATPTPSIALKTLQNGISIFPNPCSNNATIYSNSCSDNIPVLEIFDLQGRIVRSLDGRGDGVFEFDRAGLPAGLYRVRVRHCNIRTEPLLIIDEN